MNVPCSFCRSTTHATFGQPAWHLAKQLLTAWKTFSEYSLEQFYVVPQENNTLKTFVFLHSPAPRWKESSTLAEGVERRVHCSIWSPLQSDHFKIIQVCSFIHAKTQTDWLTLSAAPVTQLYPWSQRFQVSHEHGCSGRSNPHALEQQLLLNQDGNSWGASATEGLNTPTLQGRDGLGSDLPTAGAPLPGLVLWHTGLFDTICLITDKRTWPLHDLTQLKADMLSPHCPPPVKIKGHLDQKEPVHTDFKLH